MIAPTLSISAQHITRTALGTAAAHGLGATVALYEARPTGGWGDAASSTSVPAAVYTGRGTYVSGPALRETDATGSSALDADFGVRVRASAALSALVDGALVARVTLPDGSTVDAHLLSAVLGAVSTVLRFRLKTI
ncbi:MAG: hypothetical protein AAFU38_10115 [Bacteroidota bacterium]